MFWYFLFIKTHTHTHFYGKQRKSGFATHCIIVYGVRYVFEQQWVYSGDMSTLKPE